MGKYEPLWNRVREMGLGNFKLTFDEIQRILGFPIDHAFLSCKKELADYGYKVGKISIKEKTVAFEKLP